MRQVIPWVRGFSTAVLSPVAKRVANDSLDALYTTDILYAGP